MSNQKQATRAKQTSLEIPVKKVASDATFPTKAYSTDACFDLYALRTTRIPGGGLEKVRTGIAFAIPPGFFGKVYERSGLSSNRKLAIKAGVIDSGYTGEIMLIVHNLSDYPEVIDAGTKLAQIAIHELPAVELKQVDELPTTLRAENGFGSSDIKQ